MKYERHVFVCLTHRPPVRPSCGARGAEEVLEAFRAEIDRRGLAGRVGLNGSTCLGPCDAEGGPAAVVYPDGVWYGRLAPADVAEIVERHLVGGTPVERLVWRG